MLKKESESHLYESDFTEEEWQAIMDVKVPNVDSNVNDTVGKRMILHQLKEQS